MRLAAAVLALALLPATGAHAAQKLGPTFLTQQRAYCNEMLAVCRKRCERAGGAADVAACVAERCTDSHRRCLAAARPKLSR